MSLQMLDNLKEKAIFLIGDIHNAPRFPYFGIGEREKLISKDEVDYARTFVEYGYIGLHREAGYLSNKFIGGFFKHGFGFVGDGKCTEAISEGVVHRSEAYPLESDYAVILKPLISRDARQEAVSRWLRVAAMKPKYDCSFTFDLKIAEEMFADRALAEAHMRNGYTGFSCTEWVMFGLIGERRKLGLYREKVFGKEVFMPDRFMSMQGFKVAWASKSTTPEVAASLGLREEGVEMLKEYWQGNYAS